MLIFFVIEQASRRNIIIRPLELLNKLIQMIKCRIFRTLGEPFVQYIDAYLTCGGHHLGFISIKLKTDFRKFIVRVHKVKGGVFLSL
jgi:hypothetical protein